MEPSGLLFQGSFEEGKAHGKIFISFGTQEIVTLCDFFFGKPHGSLLMVSEIEFWEGHIDSEKNGNSEEIRAEGMAGPFIAMDNQGAYFQGTFNEHNMKVGTEVYPFLSVLLKAKGEWMGENLWNGVRTKSDGKTEIEYSVQEGILQKKVERIYDENKNLVEERILNETYEEVEDPLPPLTSYQGPLNEQNEPHGVGRLIENDPIFFKLLDGKEYPFHYQIYEGNFQNGKKEEKGELSRYSAFNIPSARLRGIWKDDKFWKGEELVFTLHGSVLHFIWNEGIIIVRAVLTRHAEEFQSIFNYKNLHQYFLNSNF